MTEQARIAKEPRIMEEAITEEARIVDDKTKHHISDPIPYFSMFHQWVLRHSVGKGQRASKNRRGGKND
ncbi:hypothetical protein BT93_A0694 [Corymbia citriodora subsp. variegata]|nr:hypothetical protein BT93_A0694 [Corymbia citriodora subsp. variegata]KAF8042158.1 hypothetical protein BT93_A0694 [Corymbia citriodora subsp. variegata]